MLFLLSNKTAIYVLFNDSKFNTAISSRVRKDRGAHALRQVEPNYQSMKPYIVDFFPRSTLFIRINNLYYKLKNKYKNKFPSK